MEIESKWLLSGLPNVEFESCSFIENHYILPGVRIRSKDDSKFTLTIKTETNDSGMRLEDECFITENVFKALKKHAIKKICKTRQVFRGFEFDEFRDGTIIVEKEFSSLVERNQFVVPDFLEPFIIKDVTNDLNYRNENMC